VRRDSRDFVFGSGDRGFSGWSKAKAELDARITAARLVASKKGKAEPMPEWVLHDLRRSLSTGMHEASPDGVLVYFGYPQAHEDDAERAVRAHGP
jgi:hypothetical protein